MMHTGAGSSVVSTRQPEPNYPPFVTRPRIPDWLIGLLLAIVVTAVLYVLFGAGDDPTLAGG